ncbi:MAG TPA: M23 family metallopeptidase, partial [Spirochaetota bacterium]|nr:M23 family metallopeptidase [Spirochaetota bacterium]
IHPGDKLKIPCLSGIYYKVKKYDTPAAIAAKFNISIASIKKYNKTDPYLQIGQKLFLYQATIPPAQRELIFGSFFIKPVSGYLSSPYGMRMHPIKNRLLMHTGVDIAGNYNRKVKAARRGKIIFAGKKGGYGNYVIIKHRYGYHTCYGHLKAIKVKKGGYVKKGQSIGRVGNTGLSTGPHLHFEIKHNGRYVNPKRFLNI